MALATLAQFNTHMNSSTEFSKYTYR